MCPVINSAKINPERRLRTDKTYDGKKSETSSLGDLDKQLVWSLQRHDDRSRREKNNRNYTSRRQWKVRSTPGKRRGKDGEKKIIFMIIIMLLMMDDDLAKGNVELRDGGFVKRCGRIKLTNVETEGDCKENH